MASSRSVIVKLLRSMQRGPLRVKTEDLHREATRVGGRLGGRLQKWEAEARGGSGRGEAREDIAQCTEEHKDSQARQLRRRSRRRTPTPRAAHESPVHYPCSARAGCPRPVRQVCAGRQRTSPTRPRACARAVCRARMRERAPLPLWSRSGVLMPHQRQPWQQAMHGPVDTHITLGERSSFRVCEKGRRGKWRAGGEGLCRPWP